MTPPPRWRRAAAVFSYIFAFLSLLLAVASLSAREGSEQRVDRSIDPALRALTSPAVVDTWRDKQPSRAQITHPLTEVHLSRGDGERVNHTSVCLPSLPEGSDALAQLEVLWLRTSGGPREIIATHRLDALGGETHARKGQQCIVLPPLNLHAGERGSVFALFLLGAQHDDSSDWLRDGSLTIISVTSPTLSWAEYFAAMLMLFAMLMRLYVWHTTPPREDPARLPWRVFDVFLAGVVLALVWGLSVAFIGKEPDSGLKMLLLLHTPLLGYIIMPHLIALRRFQPASTALALVRPARHNTLAALGGGALLGALSVGLLALIGAPNQSSHIQEMARLPGGALALLIATFTTCWFEEHMWRGFVFGAFEATLGALLAGALTTGLHLLLLAPQHWGYLWPLLPIGAMSAGACWLRARGRSATLSFALNLGFRTAFVAAIAFGWLSAGQL